MSPYGIAWPHRGQSVGCSPPYTPILPLIRGTLSAAVLLLLASAIRLSARPIDFAATRTSYAYSPPRGIAAAEPLAQRVTTGWHRQREEARQDDRRIRQGCRFVHLLQLGQGEALLRWRCLSSRALLPDLYVYRAQDYGSQVRGAAATGTSS